MTLQDRNGNAVTMSDERALAAWNETIENVMAHAAATPHSLSRVLDHEPDFAMGLAAKGLMVLTLARGELRAVAVDMLAGSRAAAVATAATAREIAYVDALESWLAGRPGGAAERLEAVLERHPHDVLAFKFAHAIRFMMGDRHGMTAAAARHGASFDEEVPLAGYVMGCAAFALEESGLYGAAERIGRRAIAIEPRDAWGRHAVAHVMEMTGRVEEGIAFLSGSTDTWRHCNNFSGHLFWHLALMHLQAGEIDRVLALYDGAVRAERTDDYRDIANAVSLLARLEFDGVDVGDRWEELGEIASRRVADRQMVFADLHYMLALLRSGANGGAHRLVRALVSDGNRAQTHDSRVAGDVGSTLALGLVAFEAGNFDEAAKCLGMARPRLLQIGGSNAQRDLFEQIHVESLVGAGRLDEAGRLAKERLGAGRSVDDRVVQRVLEASRRNPSFAVGAAGFGGERVPCHG